MGVAAPPCSPFPAKGYANLAPLDGPDLEPLERPAEAGIESSQYSCFSWVRTAPSIIWNSRSLKQTSWPDTCGERSPRLAGASRTTPADTPATCANRHQVVTWTREGDLDLIPGQEPDSPTRKEFPATKFGNQN